MLVISRDGIDGSFAFKVLRVEEIKIKNQEKGHHYLRLEVEELLNNIKYDQIFIQINEDDNTRGQKAIEALKSSTTLTEQITISDYVQRFYLKINSIQNPLEFYDSKVTGYLINMPTYLSLEDDRKLYANDFLS